jgi:ATP-dependent Clp protease ATP-binding subunit ClpC
MLADLGYDPEMGARPLRRVIQQKVEDRLSDALLLGEFEDGDTVVVDVVDNDIQIHSLETQSTEEEPLPAG